MLVNFNYKWALPVEKIKWIKIKEGLFGGYRIVVKCGWHRFRSDRYTSYGNTITAYEDFLKQTNQALSIIGRGYVI